ncbi:FHA domain-containing protein [Nocardioides panacisoli]|uniref:FHA domain-containing protein n=1 Tax=Nocardioides panacisoli TaxID=627624 RepID=UPI001C62AEA6|nr:FHA domain-containing protein [Nocardioides panacisoli]QYJ04486.1 FHA domain-containing protein [Nocardioides panacisoli]
MRTCPIGHESAADDYCDVCGLPISGASEAPAPLHVSASALEESHEQVAPDSTCPNCGVSSPPNALFCEACGYDFTTGAAPRTAPQPVVTDEDLADAAAAEGAWVVEVWIDPDWYAEQDSTEDLPSAGAPVVVPLVTKSVLVGRSSSRSESDPDVDVPGDNGVSRRHCRLTTDGSRWWVEDLASSNGTYVGPSVGAVPDQPLRPGERRELAEGDRLYLGAWTRLVLRPAGDEEG